VFFLQGINCEYHFSLTSAVPMLISTDIIDVYLMYANSALAANTFLRSLFGAGFPLFAVQMV